MRAVFLSHYFPPENGAAPARIAALTHGLAATGLSVSVHTGFPHYPDGAIKPPHRNRLWQREPGEVPVLRSVILPVANRGFARRLSDHTAFAAGAVATAALSGPADVVIVESPPLFTAAAAVVYARSKRAGLIINVADRWPATAVELGALEHPAAIRAAEALERWCYHHADVITTPTRGIARDLRALPQAGTKVEWVAPAVDLERFDPRPRTEASGPLRVLYAGAAGLAQGLTTLVEAARLAGPDVIQLTIAGDGAEAAQVQAALADLDHVRWLGNRPPRDIPALYRDSDVGAVLLRGQRILEGAFPTKLLEVMAAGRPVLLSARGEAAEEVVEAGSGIVVAPDDPSAMADALRRLHGERSKLAAMGAAGRRRVQERYSRSRSVEQWADLLRGVTARRARPHSSTAAAARRPPD